MQLLLGFILAVIVAVLAQRAHSLSMGGALAAILVGTLVFGLGGWHWAVLLLVFFISSSTLTRIFKSRKLELSEKFSKGGQRDAGQVLGNGGVATIFVLFHSFFPDALWPWLGFAGALAAVNADTWATELGVLNSGLPYLITNLKRRVERGTSGGVSPFGTFSSLLGSVLIAVFSAWLAPDPAHRWLLFFLVAIGGLIGSLFDSFLGATVQAMYFCPKDQKETEKHPLHSCGTQTVHRRGWKWLDNDWVNAACSLGGALLALTLVLLLS